MRKSLVGLSWVLAAQLGLVSTVPAETCIKYGPSGQRIHYLCPEPVARRLAFDWQVRTTAKNGQVVAKEILTDSICTNYPEGSIDYRTCRRQAKDYLEETCAQLTERYRTTPSPYHLQYQVDKDSFCRAAHQM